MALYITTVEDICSDRNLAKTACTLCSDDLLILLLSDDSTDEWQELQMIAEKKGFHIQKAPRRIGNQHGAVFLLLFVIHNAQQVRIDFAGEFCLIFDGIPQKGKESDECRHSKGCRKKCGRGILFGRNLVRWHTGNLRLLQCLQHYIRNNIVGNARIIVQYRL